MFTVTAFGRSMSYDPNDLFILDTMVSEFDDRPAHEQIDDNYAHGGGWNSFKGFSMDPVSNALTYEGETPLFPFAEATVNTERLFLYECSWLAIVQPDGSFDVSRID